MAGDAGPVSDADGAWSRLVRPEGVRRLGQALWMMVGQRVNPGSLVWARGLLGPDGDAALWQALEEYDCVREPDFVLRPQPLAAFLCSLWVPQSPADQAARLVWTLPPQLTVADIARDGYVLAAVELMGCARSRVTLVSPYLEPKGMGRLHEGLLGALHRGVAVLLLTHDVEDLSSLASASLEALRRDSAGLPGLFTVFTATAMPQVLLHLKIIVADDARAIVGSANVTGKGFGANLEAGVLMGPREASEVCRVVQAVIAGGLVRKAFSNQW